MAPNHGTLCVCPIWSPSTSGTISRKYRLTPRLLARQSRCSQRCSSMLHKNKGLHYLPVCSCHIAFGTHELALLCYYKGKDLVHFGLDMQVCDLKRLCKESKIKFSSQATKAALVHLLLTGLTSETTNVDAISGVNLEKANKSLQTVHSRSRHIPRSKIWQLPASFNSLLYISKHGRRVVANVKASKFLSCSVNMI